MLSALAFTWFAAVVGVPAMATEGIAPFDPDPLIDLLGDGRSML